MPVLQLSLPLSCFSALAAFYTRHFAEKVPDIKPPSLQVIYFCLLRYFVAIFQPFSTAKFHYICLSYGKRSKIGDHPTVILAFYGIHNNLLILGCNWLS